MSFADSAFRQLKDLFRSAGNSKRTRSSRAASQLSYHQHEPRHLLAGIEFTAATGQVLIGGTQEADRAVVTQLGDSIRVTQEGFTTRTFAQSEVQSILFVGLGGDDYFENQTAIRSFAYGQNGNDRLIGGSGDDSLVGNGGDDVITGNGGNDYLVAGNGNDQVFGNGGDDRFLGVRGFNQLHGGDGDDTIYGGEDRDVITGGAGENFLAGSDGDDEISGGNEFDQIFGGGGNDTIQGFGGDDRIYGQAGDDFLNGGSGSDILGGNAGDDTFIGAFGDDRILGGDGNDRSLHSGDFPEYAVDRTGPFARLEDLRGSNFGGLDLEFSIESFEFADDVLTPANIFNPLVTTPAAGDILEVVTVQPIIVSNSDGSNQAEFFGSAAQEADVKARIDEIYGQANVDIEWLPVTTLNDTFVNVGNSNNRPESDLDRVVSIGDSARAGSSNRRVLDIYFVERVPGFGDVRESTANGLAYVGGNGIAIQIGDRLVNSADGRETVAHVTAHEIGHNLGLPHVDAEDNLLTPGSDDDDLTQSQINTILASRFSQRV